MAQTAKLFMNGGSQAVRLPKEYRFDGDEVLVGRIGNMVTLAPVDDPWSKIFAALDETTDDFMAEPISDLPAQTRQGY